MNCADFVHLHLHSEFSLLDGACRIDRLFARAKELGQTAVAITDHGVMYGVIAFYKAAKSAGVRPIIGCEVYVAPRGRKEKEAALDREYHHLVLLCENMTGYHNLVKLVSLSFTEGFYQKPRVDMELLREYHEGLIALSACLAGKVPSEILAGNIDGAKGAALELESIFGKDHFYLEMQDHGIPEELRVNAAICRIARETDIPLVATNDVHYLNKEDAESHDALLCIQTGKTLADEDRMRFQTDEFYFKSTEEMAALFYKTPEAITNTARIAERCRVEFDFTDAHLPKFINEHGLSSDEYLEKCARAGLEAILSADPNKDRAEYQARLAYELKTIREMGFSDYFLIVADFVGFAKRSGIYVGPGRGSGAGSLVALCLHITELDPIEKGLIFERFLNPERVSMPDFDIDFCYERRHEVIEYVTEKYGPDHVSQIVTFSTLAPRAVVRDVGRVMGLPYSEVDQIARRIPQFRDVTLKKAIEDDPELQKLATLEQNRKLIRIASDLEGMPRNASIHAAGVLLTDLPVSDYVPLAVNTGAKVTQYTMNEIADLGLLKIDFLGLRYLTIIRDTVDLIRKNKPDFDIHNIPLADTNTFEMISRGQTAGMFQIESSGMKALMTQLKPRSIEDITAAIALYRPGPKDSIPRFLESRRSGNVTYLVPELEEILRETHGCIVYQEQVMEVFRRLAGYTFGRADIVRRAMAKKKKDVLEKERETFIEGCAKNGIKKDTAAQIFAQMADFANYAFNKSHAACYALLSYQTAYLKCNYPREFMAAILTCQLSGDKYAYYFDECRKMNIRVLPPDINRSVNSFSVDGEHLRFGLVGIKNVGESFVEKIFEERRRAPFVSFEDFTARMKGKGLNKKALESLVLSGAFDAFHIYRSKMLSVMESLLEARAGTSDLLPGQMSLFDGAPGTFSPVGAVEYPDIAELSLEEKLKGEKSACGVYLSGHPLGAYRELAERLNTTQTIRFITEKERFRENEPVILLCLIDNIVLKQVRSGEKMAFLQAEDESGQVEAVVFPKTLFAFGDAIKTDAAVVIVGSVNLKDDEIKIIAQKILTPEEAEKAGWADQKKYETARTPDFQRVSKMYLRIPAQSCKIERRVLGLLKIFPGEKPVYLYYRDTEKLFSSKDLGVCLTPVVYQELCEILGSENVVLK